jgi:plasmid stabilization system protein ParE
MTSKCFLSPLAEQDVDEIVTYIAKENPASAHAFLDALFDTMEKLADYPDMGHLRDDLTDKPVKFWTFKWHYLIIYKPTSPIEIVRVLSGYRDIINLIG